MTESEAPRNNGQAWSDLGSFVARDVFSRRADLSSIDEELIVLPGSESTMPLRSAFRVEILRIAISAWAHALKEQGLEVGWNHDLVDVYVGNIAADAAAKLTALLEEAGEPLPSYTDEYEETAPAEWLGLHEWWSTGERYSDTPRTIPTFKGEAAAPIDAIAAMCLRGYWVSQNEAHKSSRAAGTLIMKAYQGELIDGELTASPGRTGCAAILFAMIMQFAERA